MSIIIGQMTQCFVTQRLRKQLRRSLAVLDRTTEQQYTPALTMLIISVKHRAETPGDNSNCICRKRSYLHISTAYNMGNIDVSHISDITRLPCIIQDQFSFCITVDCVPDENRLCSALGIGLKVFISGHPKIFRYLLLPQVIAMTITVITTMFDATLDNNKYS